MKTNATTVMMVPDDKEENRLKVPETVNAKLS